MIEFILFTLWVVLVLVLGHIFAELILSTVYPDNYLTDLNATLDCLITKVDQSNNFKQMALIKNVNLALFDERHWEKGEYSGTAYSGFTKDGSIITFQSKRTSFPVYDIGGYDDSKSRDFRLVGRQYQDQPIRWQLDETLDD